MFLPPNGLCALSGDFEGVPRDFRIVSFFGVYNACVPASEGWLIADADLCCDLGVLNPLLTCKAEALCLIKYRSN
jgi:hypothetical protein